MKSLFGRTAFSALFFALILSSCTVEDEYTFNKDFTGKHVFKLTFEEYEGRNMGEMMIPKLAEDKEGQEEAIRKMDSIPGVSNSYFTAEGTSLTMGYDFENLEVIGQPLTVMGKNSAASRNPAGGSAEDFIKRFEVKGNKIYIYEKEAESPDMGDTPAKMKEMLASISYTTVYRFAKKVKSVSDKRYIISDDKMSVGATFTGDDEDTKSDGKPLIIEF